MRTVRIGLTGPIGCGKSTVAGMLAEHGAVVIDADRLVREVYEDAAVRAAVVGGASDRPFGRPMARSTDARWRGSCSTIPEALRDLEAIIHPAVRPRILAGIDAADTSRARAVVVEAIKLVESGLAELCDEVWLVTCDPPIQRGRPQGSRHPGRRRRPAHRRPAPSPRPGRTSRDSPDRHVRDARRDAHRRRARLEQNQPLTAAGSGPMIDARNGAAVQARPPIGGSSPV